MLKERASSKSLTHVLVYFKVLYIEPEECPVEVLCNSLQDERYNPLSKLLTTVASEEDKEVEKEEIEKEIEKVEYQEEEDQEKLQNTFSVLVS